MQNPYEKKLGQPEVGPSADNGKPEQKTSKRRFTHLLLKPLLWAVVNLLWASCRKKIIGQENMDQVLAGGKPVIPCYWHQQQLFCGWYMLQQIKQGMKVGFLISPSVDGEIPANIVAAKGARVFAARPPVPVLRRCVICISSLSEMGFHQSQHPMVPPARYLV